MTGKAFHVATRASRCAAVAAIVWSLVTVAPAHMLHAQETGSSILPAVADDRSTEDGKENEKKAGGGSFLPVPIFITEPAIGVGLGVALSYFHKRKESADTEPSITPAMSLGTPRDTATKKKSPPTVTAVVGAYTDNGTWATGLAHSRSMRRDTIRYTGACAYTDINSTLYRYDIPFDFEIKAGILYQDIKFRLGTSDFFLGGRLSVLAAEGRIDFGSDLPIGLGQGDTTDVGLAAQAMWETRDNVMTPNRGQLISLVAWRHDDALGSDYDYWSLNAKVNSYHPLARRFVLGWRIDVKAVDGEPPFWAYPWVSLRGVPALRYQNERVGMVELEGRYTFARRWGGVVFVGKGTTAGDNPAFETADRIFAGGVGGRYLFKPEEDIWIGIDIARGPEDTYWYIQVGQAW